MSVRLSTLAVVVAALLVAAVPAFATDEPPAPKTPTTPAKPNTPSKPRCIDTMRPASKLLGKSVRRGPVKTLRGRTRDLGCSVSGLGTVRVVQISVAAVKAGLCQFVSTKGTRTAWRKCSPARWLRVTPGAQWTLRLAKPLRPGSYLIRIRAVDSARNAEQVHGTRLTVSPSPSAAAKSKPAPHKRTARAPHSGRS